MAMPSFGLGSPTGGSLSSVTGGMKIPKGYRQGQLPQFTPEQAGLFQSLFSLVGPQSNLSRMASGEVTPEMQAEEAMASRDFQGGIGQLASRFSGAGGLGGRKSSGFQNTATQGASDFASQLMARRQELKRQALGDLMGISQSLLGQRPYEQFLTPKQMSFGKQLLAGLVPGIGSGLGNLGTLFGASKMGLF